MSCQPRKWINGDRTVWHRGDGRPENLANYFRLAFNIKPMHNEG
jgi:hypothetical protein